MIIRNGLVFEPEGGFTAREIYVDQNHIICESPPPGDHEIIDAAGMYVIPGLVDIHIHGAVGADFSDGDVEGLFRIARYLKSQGVTSFCPTSMTLPEEQLVKSFRTLEKLLKADGIARPVGINMEGPFLAKAKKGAQKSTYLMEPDIDMFRRLQNASGGRIRLVTIAPELAGATKFIRELKNEVTLSLGHTSADYDQAAAGFEAGAGHVTHLFNAMEPFLHRNPGLIGAAAERKDVYAELICDGIHVHPSAVRGAFALFGADRMILISDAMRAAGMEDGSYELGGQPVKKEGAYAALADGTLAGSVTNLADSLRNAVEFGIPLTDALKAVTVNPARSIGLEGQIGQIRPGAEADIILMDRDMNFKRVI
ncbi:MAG: N-acetylglucosamine-6-phosphate deacetylase [Bacillota bacterium]|nr:N-acetylglucosamine-6-phosphate deacetylase [Bacillota bacterium]